ncbi:MAG: transglycosylase SLT domain-containing protein, partial [Acetobacteraceae bacterium]|nr:transglycosylase SLT domain-containing protein [Acetobacteraceae bacterium]
MKRPFVHNTAVMKTFALLMFLLLVAADPVLAALQPPSPLTAATLCETAVGAAESRERLPPRMMDAIARIESGRIDPATNRLRPWPWTINAEGEGRFFATKAQAVAAVRSLQARGVRSIDVGCMQVNLMFHPNAFPSLEAALDPPGNALYAARFLNMLYGLSRDWPRAIGEYHSQTPVLGQDYRQRVLALWRRPELSGATLGLAVAYRDFQSG